MTQEEKDLALLDELKALKMTADLWNLLVKIEAKRQFNPNDLPEHMRDIHNIQNRIMAREHLRNREIADELSKRLGNEQN